MFREIFNMIDYKSLAMLLMLCGLACVVVFVAIFVDLASGYKKAKFVGEPIESEKLRRTSLKLLLNGGLCLIASMIDLLLYFGHLWTVLHLDVLRGVPVVTFVVAVWLCAVQWVSVKEKAEDKAERKTAELARSVMQAITQEEVAALISKLQKGGNDENLEERQ